MNSTDFLYLGAGILLVLALVYLALTADKKKNERFRRMIEKAYGVVPKREYTQEELLKISRLFTYGKEKCTFFVDDITWHDFHGDDIFEKMNHTFSSPGEEVLYAMLRLPVFNQEELQKRDELIRYFDAHEEMRKNMSLEFARIGRTRKISLVDFLELLQSISLKPDVSYLYHGFLTLASLIFACFLPKYGIALFILVLVLNIYTYYRNKAELENHYVALTAMAYLVNGASQIDEIWKKAGEKTRDGENLAGLLARIEEILPKVDSLKKKYKWLGGGGSFNMSQDILSIFLDFFRMMTHFDLYEYNQMVKKVQNEREELLELFHLMGYLECMIALSSYRRTLPYYTTGEFTEGKEPSDAQKPSTFIIEEGYHPLIRSREPVPNSIREDKSVLITGSNASGKSTFLRMCGLCALLAQTVNTVHARKYQGPFFRIYSSMALSDSIATDESYYMVEIRSMKRMMDAVQDGKGKVLIFVDEVLRGTNTVERIAASSEILKKMADEGAFVFAATHDIELSEILGRIYANYHFTEVIEQGEIHFTFRLLPGPATSRNAIKLLQVMGYEDQVVQSAERRAEAFSDKRKWENF